MTEYTEADFKQAEFARHADGDTAIRRGNAWEARFDRVTSADMVHDGWVPVQEARPVEQELTIDDDVIRRALNAWHGRSHSPHSADDWTRMLLALRAAHTPLPARPEGAEQIEAVLAALDDFGGDVPAPTVTYAQRARFADLLAEHSVRVMGEQS